MKNNIFDNTSKEFVCRACCKFLDSDELDNGNCPICKSDENVFINDLNDEEYESNVLSIDEKRNTLYDWIRNLDEEALDNLIKEYLDYNLSSIDKKRTVLYDWIRNLDEYSLDNLIEEYIN